MIAKLIRWSIANRFLVLLATLMVTAWGVWSLLQHAARRDSRSLRRAGDHSHDLSGSGAADRREPDHLSADDDDALGARREDGARLFDVRRFVRLHPVRGRHRSVLGALARARVSEPGAVAPARAGQGLARSGRDRRGLGLRVRADRSHRQDGSVAAARAAGLVPQVRAEDGPQRIGGRERRRHGAPVSDRARSRSAARLQHSARQGDRRRAEGEPGDRRLGAGARRSRVHGARFRLPAVARRLPPDSADDDRRRRSGAPGRRRAHPGRSGDAPRHRRAERRRRGGGRHHRHALGQERAGDDRRGQGQAREAQDRACRRASRSCRPTIARASSSARWTTCRKS